MKSVLTSSFLVVALLALDAASVVSAKPHTNGTAIVRRSKRRHNHGKRTCTKSSTSIPPITTSVVESQTASTTVTETSTDTFVSTSSTESSSAPTSTSSSGSSATEGSSGNGGLVNSNFQCDGQSSGATTDISTTNGPNGSQDWLDCGLSTSSDGWNPPVLSMTDLVYVSLDDALQMDDTPFSACSQYLDIFNKYADEYQIPAIFIASFALQESSCQANTVGGNGEQGLMQITQDKCNPPSGTDCKDPDYNVSVGAKYFKDTLDSFNGDVLQAIGQYNGWYKGMTEQDVKDMIGKCGCWCQENMDYLMQFLNGWAQGKDAYSLNLGKYQNYASCS